MLGQKTEPMLPQETNYLLFVLVMERTSGSKLHLVLVSGFAGYRAFQLSRISSQYDILYFICVLSGQRLEPYTVCPGCSDPFYIVS